MVNWFIVVLGIIGIFLIIKMIHLRHLKHKLVGIFIVFLLLFLIGSIYLVSKENNVDMTTANGFLKGMQVYAGWLLNSFQNIGALTGYAIGLDWSLENKTISMDNSFINKTFETLNDTANKVKANTPRLITSYK